MGEPKMHRNSFQINLPQMLEIYLIALSSSYLLNLFNEDLRVQMAPPQGSSV